MAQDQTAPQDPTEQYAKPEQSPEQLEHPGLEHEMQQRPDYGEDTYEGSGRLEGRRAVITGGDSGIGRAVALAFAREGADVMLSYLPAEESDADETVQVVEAAGRRAVKAPGDLQDPAYCRAIVERAVSEFGGIDVLVNNAAYQMSRQGIASITQEELERTFRVNIISMFYTCQAALEHMEAGSSIINTASIQAYQPSPELLDYATTKAAIANFTRGLAQEVAERGIRVNFVAPGPIWTPLIPATMPAEQVKSFGAATAIGRAGQPAELAPAYVFLASQESSYITGERLGVHGGMPLP
jgi:NAD(P)-dependent dehydrogenase (short-subunit alcohol dehydrogenase family)